jgi:protein Mpv17
MIHKYPLVSGLLFTTLKTSAADLIVQKYIDQKKEIDLRRNTLFSFFGLTYLGGWQYYLYNHIFERRFKNPFTKVLVDQFIHHPFGYFPTFYILKSIVYEQSFTDALTTYKTNIISDLLACWSIWIPSQYINFKYVSIPYRIPFVCCISFGWTGFLSWKRSSHE